MNTKAQSDLERAASLIDTVKAVSFGGVLAFVLFFFWTYGSGHL